MTSNGPCPGIVLLYTLLPLSVGGTCEYDEIVLLWQKDFADIMISQVS